MLIKITVFLMATALVCVLLETFSISRGYSLKSFMRILRLNAFERIKEINNKLNILQQVNKWTNEIQKNIASRVIVDSPLVRDYDRESVTSFAIGLPLSSKWLYASSSHNGKHRTTRLGISTNEPTHNF
jgi:hypothetical protein